jgi:hypothetical protein
MIENREDHTLFDHRTLKMMRISSKWSHGRKNLTYIGKDEAYTLTTR